MPSRALRYDALFPRQSGSGAGWGSIPQLMAFGRNPSQWWVKQRQLTKKFRCQLTLKFQPQNWKAVKCSTSQFKTEWTQYTYRRLCLGLLLLMQLVKIGRKQCPAPSCRYCSFQPTRTRRTAQRDTCGCSMTDGGHKAALCEFLPKLGRKPRAFQLSPMTAPVNGRRCEWRAGWI